MLEFAVDLGADKFEPIGIDKVKAGEDDQAVVDAQKVADGEMFASLWHDAFIGGDHQHHKVHSAGTCDHGADQAFVFREHRRCQCERLLREEKRRPKSIVIPRRCSSGRRSVRWPVSASGQGCFSRGRCVRLFRGFGASYGDLFVFARWVWVAYLLRKAYKTAFDVCALRQSAVKQ